MIKKATLSDLDFLANLAAMLWDNHTIESLKTEFLEIIPKNDSVFFLVFEEQAPVGFAHCQLRNDYVEGTETSPVGYLEGIFIKEDFRRKGYAKKLLYECEEWAISKGCVEFASDCEFSNETSRIFHINSGFKEVNKIICFNKKLKNENQNKLMI